MATIRRHPAAAGLAFLAVGCVVVLGGFLLVLRAVGSDPSPGLLSAQGMAHRLLSGRESIDTDVQRSGEYVFRVVYQTSDGNVGATLAATHIGVAVCLRGDTATDGGALLLPALQAGVPRRAPAADPGADLRRRGPRGVRRRLRARRRPARRADPEADRLAVAGGRYFFVRMLASTQAWRLTWP